VAVLVASTHTELDSYKRGNGGFGETSIPTEFDSQRGCRFIQRGGVATLVLNSRKTLNPRISKQCALTISGPFGAPGKKNRIN
jgi:hypothetical protein